MRELKLRILNDNENPGCNIYNLTLENVDYLNLKGVAEQLQVYLEEKIYPIKITFIGENSSYDAFELHLTRKQAKSMLINIIPCPKEGMKLKFRGIRWE